MWEGGGGMLLPRARKEEYRQDIPVPNQEDTWEPKHLSPTVATENLREDSSKDHPPWSQHDGSQGNREMAAGLPIILTRPVLLHPSWEEKELWEQPSPDPNTPFSLLLCLTKRHCLPFLHTASQAAAY